MAPTVAGKETGRAARALLAVLPKSAVVDRHDDDQVRVNGQLLLIAWLGEGRLAGVRDLLARPARPTVAVARRFSPGARSALAEAGVGWVDESGAAQIAVGSIVIALTGMPDVADRRPKGWTASALAVAEALLCGTSATTSAVGLATGLSTGSCVNALRILSDLGLLEADAARGRGSARRLVDASRMLDAYAAAAAPMASGLKLQIGVTWRDTIDGTIATSRRLDDGGVRHAVTGTVASFMLAPYLTNVTTAEIYVPGHTILDLESAARAGGLRPVPGGRLTLRPFPTVTAQRLRQRIDELWVAPWPRVYVDLLHAGVRGEDAAEHLKEVINGR